MNLEVVEHAPRTRCYQCGTIALTGICHHCGRALCARHNPPVTDAAGTLLSDEFVRLGLKETECGEGPLHCESCAHIVKGPRIWPIAVGAIVALIGLMILTWSAAVGFPAMLIGAALIAGGVYINQRRQAQALQSRPPAPLIPRFEPVQVEETLRGSIDLDAEGRYRISVSPVAGALTITASFGKPDQDCLQAYRKKYKLTGQNIPFHAGFAVLRGPTGLILNDGNATDFQGGRVLPLRGQASEHPFLQGSGPQGSGEWRTTRTYRLLDASGPATLPIRLVPSFVQETGQQALDLELQWSEATPAGHEQPLDQIDLLELSVPGAWGEIEEVSDSAQVGTPFDRGNGAGVVRTLTWRRLPLRQEDRQRRRHTLFIRFECPIDPAATIRGRVEASFRGALSGIENVDLYYPLGRRRDEEPARVRTRVLVDFTLSLAELRYQDVRVVPDPKKDQELQGTKTFRGVVPNHNTVIALTNALSDDHFYVKRVIENPPRTGERADVVNRYWDIAGRRYDGVYPVDFHLIVTGEEVYSGEIQAQGGTTNTMLTVQGAYANPDMEERIENIWLQLTELIDATLQQMPRVTQATAPPQPPVPPPAAPAAIPDRAVPDHGVPDRGDRGERSAALRKRLDQLTEALLAGRISEKTYLDLKADSEREMRDLPPGS